MGTLYEAFHFSCVQTIANLWHLRPLRFDCLRSAQTIAIGAFGAKRCLSDISNV